MSPKPADVDDWHQISTRGAGQTNLQHGCMSSSLQAIRA